MNDLSQEEIDAISKAMSRSPKDLIEEPQDFSSREIPQEPSSAAYAQFVPFEEDAGRAPNHEEKNQLKQVPVKVEVILGNTHLPIAELLNLHTGSVISLDQLATEPVIIQAGGEPIAEGEVVIVEDQFGIKLTKIYAKQNSPELTQPLNPPS